MKHKAVLSIVHYQQPALLVRCLRQIQSLNLPSSWKTVVVENSPKQEGASIIQSEYPWVQILCNGKNNGFGGGHNLAYTRTASDYFFVLNPDILILDNSLQALIDCLDNHPDAAIVGPCLLNPDGSIQYSARRFYDWKTVLGRRLPLFDRHKIDDYHLMKDQDLSIIQSVDWILGAAMAIRRKAFLNDILFDPRYNLYFEDVDICYFARKRGWDVLYCPHSKMIHDHQRSSAKGINIKLFIHFLSWIKFWLKSKHYRNVLLSD